MNNAPALPIPSSWESATPADRMMIALKEAGEPWRAIREAWTEETGHEVGATTLPRRYSRIRDQMMHWKDSDVSVLLLVSKSNAITSVFTRILLLFLRSMRNPFLS